MTNEVQSVSPSQDERVMAALGHVSSIIPTIGIIAPIIIWVTQREKSRYVYMQALQAIAYHLTMILGFFLGMGCYMASFFGNFFSFALVNENTSPSPFVFAGFMIPFLVMGLIFLGWFFFIVYAIVATVMTFQGRNFRYLIIGPLIDRFMARK